jgi:hypothetical protein
VADHGREDVHDEDDERPDRRPGENADQPGEVHVNPAEYREIELEYGETRRASNPCERDPAGFKSVMSDPVDHRTEYYERKRKPESECPQREDAIGEVDVCHDGC